MGKLGSACYSIKIEKWKMKVAKGSLVVLKAKGKMASMCYKDIQFLVLWELLNKKLMRICYGINELYTSGTSG